ncbi:N, N'-diacetylbacillosaminyl-diphospho-undecaprenol alpha-1,3-N-acetylgalactosaminyltransferase [Cupriavidus pampae]|uniref:N, N'-diacetylbacillosaminyl-diphospho-undecaprenol alpha-1,3-N-acetylgalactosaminyltransferase n=2 Tax=Cupriavidus pampae TaxID=659251 RepID=A0ABM8WQD4_9BURK|nr:N, N'-diacetylbacillosaminyl-diphospho-undecaprenol alpha-1,3-N-acetylgalactosaminyltransferase [Cupriavidus pampae]
MIASFAESLIGFRGPLIAALQASGLDVHVAAPGLPAGDPVRARLEAQGLTVHDVRMQRVGTNPLVDLGTTIQLYRLMRRIRPDCVMGYTIKPVIYGTLAAWLARVPRRFALITGLGYAFQQEGGGMRELVQRMYAAALQRVRKVFFQNPDDRDLFLERGILAADTPSCVVNGSGVDVSAFSVAPLPGKTTRFLLIARLLGDKGVREFVEAARRVRAERSDATFVLVGWIDTNPNAIAQDELDTWVRDGVVEYLGKLSDVRPAIAESTVYVLPSYREGTPRTVLEAMAMGRAVITTDAPGCRETVVDGDNGFLVPVKSVDALEVAMRRFLDDPDLATRMGRRAREIAEDKYDVNKVNAVMLSEMEIR